MENLFASYNDTGTMVFSVALELDGAIDAVMWQQAVLNLPTVHPTLALTLGYAGDGRRSFLHGAGPVPLAIDNLPRVAWQAALNASIGTPFADDGSAPLRLRLFVDGDASFLIATFNHAFADGMSALLVLGDLLTLVGSGHVDPRPTPSLDEALGTDVPAFWHADRPAMPVPDMPQTHLEMRELDPTTSQQLAAAAKANGATVHAALVVALGSTLAAHGGEPIRVMSPVNVRALSAGETASAVHLTIALSPVAASDDFWERARQVSPEVTRARSAAAVRGFVLGIAGGMQQDASNAATSARLNAASIYDAVLTNMGRLSFAPRTGVPEVRKVWGPVLRPRTHVPIVGVATSSGALRLVSSSFDEAPVLGPMLRRLLSQAS